jgi:hypothetical protein
VRGKGAQKKMALPMPLSVSPLSLSLSPPPSLPPPSLLFFRLPSMVLTFASCLHCQQINRTKVSGWGKAHASADVRKESSEMEAALLAVPNAPQVPPFPFPPPPPLCFFPSAFPRFVVGAAAHR